VIYEAVPSLFKADIYVRLGTARRQEMKAILTVLLLIGYFMSAGRVKEMSSRSSQNDGNADRLGKRLLIAEVCVASVGVVIGLSSIGFLIYQMKLQTKALQRDAVATIHGGVLELDKAFLANPKLRPYFYSGRHISPADMQYNEALSIAEFQLDLFDEAIPKFVI
jgi:hypothetical protein